jgi:shikimate kinase
MADPGPGSIRHVVLTGLMGAGKTSVGAGLARRLGWPIHDSDVALLAAAGMSARDYREAFGTDALHRAEAGDLLAALDASGPTVICAAASTIEDEAARSALGQPGVVMIWLRGSPPVLAERFRSGGHRPIYGPDPMVVARSQAAIRDPLFASVARIVIDVDRLTVDQVVDRALAGLGSVSSHRPPR